MLFPERDLANEFWLFVRERAIDPRTDDDWERPPCPTLDKFEADRLFARTHIGAESNYPPDFPELQQKKPWVYPTLQEALLAFLIAEMARGEFSYTYELWLRTVVVIMADVHRDADWLRLVTCDHSNNEGREEEHTMTISDDWSCLSRDAYDFVVRTFGPKSDSSGAST